MTSSSETSRLSGRPAWAFDRRIFLNGMRDGVPIALGYFAVSFLTNGLYKMFFISSFFVDTGLIFLHDKTNEREEHSLQC